MVGCFLLLSQAVFARYGNPGNDAGSKPLHFTRIQHPGVGLSGTADLMHVSSNYHPFLRSNEVDDKSGQKGISTYIKTNAPSPYFHRDQRAGQGAFKTSTAQMPAVVNKYDGANGYPDHPPDNFLAVSDSGYIVSVMNSNYRIFHPGNAGASVNTDFYDALKSTLPSLTGAYYDPRVIYDAESQRFIIVLLNGGSAGIVQVAMLFSKTSNPADGWYTYSMSGDIYKKGEFADYPNIGLSKSDLFITLNLFIISAKGQITGTRPTIVQINKSDGYTGHTLHLVSFDPDSTTLNASSTFVPASHGLGSDYGDSMYFVANYDSTGSGVNLIEITGNETSGISDVSLDTILIYNSLIYSQPKRVKQKQDTGTHFTLNPDDVDIRQAFYLNKLVHFVFATRDQYTGFSDIVYARIDLKTLALGHADLGLDKFDYVYPSLASIAQTNTDPSVMIGYCRSDSTIYPEVDAVECDMNFNFSPSVTIAAGTSPIVQIGQDSGELRLGDYNGMARQYGTGYCFFSGSYGYQNTYETTVAQLGLARNSGIGDVQLPSKPELTVFPNPAIDVFNLDFELSSRALIRITVADIQGRQVALLYEGVQNPGHQQFFFNKAALKPGTYFVTVAGAATETVSRKIVVR